MLPTPLATRQFSAGDQARFAALSGDWNPLHLAGLSAIRGLAARPVVHGIHTLLWSLESAIGSLPGGARPGSLRAKFVRMILTGEPVSVSLAHANPVTLRLNVTTPSGLAAVICLGLQAPASAVPPIHEAPLLEPGEPWPADFEALLSFRGRIRPVSSREDVAALFPAVVSTLGAERVASLCCTSLVVGMFCPGLHSLYGGLNLAVTPLPRDDWKTLAFAVTDSNEPLHHVTLSMTGGGWAGLLDAVVRKAHRPVGGAVATKGERPAASATPMADALN